MNDPRTGVLALMLCAFAVAAQADGFIGGSEPGGFNAIPVFPQSSPLASQHLTVPVFPKPGDLCEVSKGGTGILTCGVKIECRAYPGLYPAIRVEIWQPRRDGDIFVCDNQDQPSVLESVQVPARKD